MSMTAQQVYDGCLARLNVIFQHLPVTSLHALTEKTRLFVRFVQ